MKQKHFLFTALAVFLALQISIFTACSSDSDSDNDEAPVTPVVKTFTVTFNSNPPTINGETATVTGEMSQQEFAENEEKALSTCTFTLSASSYKFAGWARTADATTVEFADGQSITLTENITLYAVWKEGGYFVTFNANAPEDLPDGVSVQGDMPHQFLEKAESGTSSVAQKLNKCTFTLTGYYFKGWAESATATTAKFEDEASVTTKSDTMLYAVWEKALTITFNKNSDDATGDMQAMSVEKGKTVTLTKCTFSRTGYIFKGWATSALSWASASYTDEKQTSFTSNTTLYAVWEAKKCKATFDKNGATSGDVTDETEYTYGATDWSGSGKFTFPENAFVYDANHVFVGWATSATPAETDKVYSALEKAVWLWDGDQTFYAVWGDKNANPLKVNGVAVGDAGAFVFDTNKTDFAFTGELFGEDFKKILDATKGLAKGVNLDFSACEGVSFALKDGDYTAPVVDKTANIKSLVLPPNLSKVPEYFFYNNDNLTSIEVNGKTETIGDCAFNLCSKLSNIKISEGVKNIGMHAFGWSDSITILEIPSSVEMLGTEICYSCSSLTAINVADGNANYSSADGVLFDKDKTKLLVYPQGKTTTAYSVPSTVTEISDSAFSENSNLKSVGIPSSVTKIGRSAFSNCSKLATVRLNSGLKTIDSNAFYNSAISSITLPDTLETLGGSAFERCLSLVSINIPTSVKTIGDDCFDIYNSTYSPAKFSSITVDSANANYSAEDGVLYNKDKTLLIKYPCAKTDTSFAIPDTVTEIKSNAFGYATNLAKVHIPQSVQTIKTSSTQDYAYGYSPFSNCASTLKIYCEAASKPAGFGYSWNYYSSSGSLTVEYGVDATAFATK